MILTHRDGDLLTITLNRPDKANALTADMMKSLITAVSGATDVKAIILTGAGKVFCAGADLDAAKAGLATSPLWEELSGAIAKLPCLTIAALNGTLAGGGFGMVLACDLRIAVPGANFFYPVMKLGYLPQPSDPWRMRALIGPSRSKQILMAGLKINAQMAHDFGLIDAVDPDPVALAKNWAADALSARPDHVAAIKSLIENK
ncbi:Enoyl-CoA hydratase/carnithine racemase [Cognatiyoonia koreensis]|uniref:Enoyl-CoA hydratase/carnithine racemase n=1 Tax=Cognatiyoonia koreensis TaxID=364200 RepID=A0A1I0RVX1_9RHOB|nr:enoyl-CoA hydratase/isomerase family protein [Cognatiyoonia koreensis]SEW44985.1 Enoyl-CoA hydratase/carnithine racemase [Cognatiyoonia koreensis]